MDAREVIAEAMVERIDKMTGDGWFRESEDVWGNDVRGETADAILQALEAEGYTVAMLERRAWILDEKDLVIPSRGPLPHEDGRPWEPLFRILPESQTNQGANDG